MAAGVEQAAIVMLAVDLDQQRAELAQQRDRSRLVVDERAAAAVGADDSADDERLARLARQAVLGEQAERGMIRRQVEADADDRLRLAVAHQARCRRARRAPGRARRAGSICRRRSRR